MNKKTPLHICAVRGQPESRDTVTRAIEIALEQNASLTFLLVVNVEFMGQSSPTMTPIKAVYQRLEEMGEFAMLILCDRARRRGVEQVDYTILRGDIAKQIYQQVMDSEADVLVLGRPLRKYPYSVFTIDEFDRFVADLEQEAGVKVIPVERG